ncbi:OmpA family protein [Paracoccus beibuensis]|uniref:OmpA family protein n=1 Tax=Paracoccus beibuensis TaxID=547602 RepID=UPI00223EF939|nr:OmpA family protein [Paracoccus beibuensis]
MRRIIHNSTAIAACLSLLAPQLAAAQQIQTDAAPLKRGLVLAQADAAAAPEDLPPAAENSEAEAATPPAGDDAAAVEDLEAALATDSAEAAEEQPADAAESASQPEAAPVEAEAAPAEAEAPAEPEAAPAEAESAPAAPEPASEADAPEASEDTAAPAEAQVEEETQDLTDALQEAEQEEAAEAEPQAGDAPAEVEAQTDAVPAANQVEEETEELTDALRDAETQAQSGDDSMADALQEAEDEAQAGAAEPADAPAAAEAEQVPAEDAAAPGGLRLATGSVQTERSGSLPGLANVLDQELSGGLAAESLTCLDGGSFPCANNGRAMTPRGVVVEANAAGELRLAPVEAQMYRVTEGGELVQRAAEEDTPETEASREAAEAGAPIDAAALNAEEGQGEVTEQTVTEETARSSSEEFATNLRDALNTATAQQPEAREEDDDDNDLTRALLLGLGAVAVGTYLNNNRQVALSTPDRVVVTRPDGSQEIIKDEVALLRQPGSTVTTENFDDGSSRTIVTREDGSRVVTIRDANLRVLRRTLVSADGQTTQLIDETADVQPVDVSQLPAPAPVQNDGTTLDEAALREALQRESDFDRRFTLSQIRNIPEVRALVAPVNIDAITFDTGSAAIRPDQAQQLQSLGAAIRGAIGDNPQEIFMIEGHTDTVGSDATNLALSDRRAESVALALSEYFDVPPENMVTQGYGEQFPRIRAEGDIRDNRRASVRRITDLLAR